MLRQIKRTIRKIIKSIAGENFFSEYHKALALIASNYYGNPSKKMLVVAVTGTKGKTSTLNFLWHVLTAGGYKVGLISTANIKIGNKEKMNWYHMTMPGRFLLQSLLKEMLDAKCDIVLVEATSEGIKQNRHIGLYYDVTVFTNLFPEHLQSHNNSFEEYRMMKGKLFENLKTLPEKTTPSGLSGHLPQGKDASHGEAPRSGEGVALEKISIINTDSTDGEFFAKFDADQTFTYGFENGKFLATNVKQKSDGVEFEIQTTPITSLTKEGLGVVFKIPILGIFNIYNCLPAIILGKYLGMKDEDLQQGVLNCSVIPGRMELINEGQNFTAIVDYAHEGVSLRLALEAAVAAKKNKESKVFVLYGAEGGGRDLKKRDTMSKAASELADYVMVTLSDPFDADPEEINQDIIKFLKIYGMQTEEKIVDGKNIQNVWNYIDRRQAIKHAVDMAKDGDVILFASKGAEQSIIFKDHTEKWDDREEVRAAINAKLTGN
jgi:UDP-N-acetylmuramoyl-L-alanyl-D-glutamate--2,6-diaminopimelate ligase